MGHVRHHLAARALQPLKLGHIPQREHFNELGAILERDDARVEQPRPKLDAALHPLAAHKLRRLYQLDQLRAVDHLNQRRANRRAAEYRLGGQICQQDALIRIEHEDRFVDRPQDALLTPMRPFERGAQRPLALREPSLQRAYPHERQRQRDQQRGGQRQQPDGSARVHLSQPSKR